MNPTDEQILARDAFKTGESLVIEAGAGTGKTSTLVLCAEATSRRGQYLAFNRAIVADSGARFPENVAARTMHSLAFGAVGRTYKARLDAGRRIRSEDIARALRIDPIEVSTGAGSDKRRLAPGWLAGRVMEAVGRFCQSADEVPGLSHFGYVDGLDLPTPDGKRGYTINREVNRYLLPFLTRAWVDLCQTRGTLRFEHSTYLKLAQLGGMVIPADFIMFDEAQDCQPPGTMVATPGGERPIESLLIGDRVVAYNQSALRLNPSGNVVHNITVRPHDGPMIEAKSDTGRVSRYTPEHICIAKLGPAFEGKTLVYLMRRGDQFRVGTTSAHHGGRGNTAGVRGRLFEEKGESAWILAAFDTKLDALLEEQFVSASFGVPQVRFVGDRFGVGDRERVERFWERFGDNAAGGIAALTAYGRDVRYPLINRDRRYLLYVRATEVRACNLMDGMLQLDADRFAASGGRGSSPDAWRPVAVTRSHYSGPVYSLDVAVNHTYIADGMMTHNCAPVMRAIVEAQDAQRIWVGDSAQEIYSWTGAQNALAQVSADQTCFLTQSFRFGPAVAAVANAVLAKLDTPMRLRGLESIHSEVVLEGEGPEPDCILTRTNAASVREVISARAAGRSVHLVGGGAEVLAFARAAEQLIESGHTTHRELSCFQDWAAVQAYVITDALGGELRLLVQLVDEFGVRMIEKALAHMPKETDAELIVSTAHKAKGREWRRVRLGDDFPPLGETGLEPPELRLLYVAATRAKNVLDLSACPTLATIVAGKDASGG